MAAYAAMALGISQCLASSVNSIACSASLTDTIGPGLSESDPKEYPACAKSNLMWLITAFINSLTDLILLVLPLWILRPLRARWEKKLATTGVLMGGGL